MRPALLLAYFSCIFQHPTDGDLSYDPKHTRPFTSPFDGLAGRPPGGGGGGGPPRPPGGGGGGGGGGGILAKARSQ
jgi:hypothetical protein